MLIAEHLYRKQLLDTIAVLSSTPAERLTGEWGTDAHISTDVDTSEAGSQARLQRLYKLVGADGEEQKKRLLAQLQFSHEQIIRSTSSATPMEITSQPAWVVTLEQILRDHTTGTSLYGVGTDSRDLCLNPEKPVPFEELLLPFIRYARRQLLALVPTRPLLLSLDAYCTLERWLLELLIGLAGQVLQNTFSDFRMRHSSLIDSSLEGDKSRAIYNAFLYQYGGEGLLPLFIEYSVLARLLMLRVEQWIETCEEFLLRLEEDREAIERQFQYDQSLGSVVEMQAGCSDAHYNGRSVLIMRFSNGHKLIYKPRCLDADRAFFRLCAWINARGLPLQLKGLRILSRTTHGWMEYAEYIPCKARDEIQRYYQRAGQLVCLFYVLQASDMHYENIIASGEYPIPIDLETIMTPRSISLSLDAAGAGGGLQIQNAIDYSVYQSTLLPMKLPIRGKSLDLSFLGCISDVDSPYEALRWNDINTDAMRQIYKTASIGSSKNAVVFDGSIIKPSDYLEDIVTGFRTMYNLLTKYRDDFLAPWGPLVSFIGCPLRYIFRSTFIYEKLLARLNHPRFLRDGVDRWIEMQIFKRPLLKNNADPRFWVLIEAEVSALQRLDVPRFGLLPEGNDLLTDEGAPVENIFDRSALDQVRACLVQLGVEDLERQVDLIRDAFADTSVMPTEASTR